MNTFGRQLRVTLRGGSHTAEIAVVVEGIPAGVALDEGMFAADLDRRRPRTVGTTARRESDFPHIAGLCDGRTTGEALEIVFRNENIRRSDYSRFADCPRPSHADLTQRRKYGDCCDISGGGQASGRMTVALVAAGVVAKRIVPWACFSTRLVSVGGQTDPMLFDDEIAAAAAAGDSVGGVVECRVSGMRVSLGEPFFDSAESMISHLVFSVPGVKGIEFGDGFEGARKHGSERNDAIVDAGGRTATNNEGGINGGITNGNDVVFRVAVKPTASISREQVTYDFSTGRMERLVVGGRHDACIARRAMVVIEAVAAIALADMYLVESRS
ncbi:MAG: chorismate synthase [Alistipes sp.]|nr:chorismate synthase [Alistipes sp.]MDE7129767.1 chorismate synthase [Alistipes sp.]